MLRLGKSAHPLFLDYAVGSGAFPMATLHKLPFALRRLDPPQPTHNQRRQQLQKERARAQADAAFDAKAPMPAKPNSMKSATLSSGIQATSGASYTSFKTATSAGIFSPSPRRSPSCASSSRWPSNNNSTTTTRTRPNPRRPTTAILTGRQPPITLPHHPSSRETAPPKQRQRTPQRRLLLCCCRQNRQLEPLRYKRPQADWFDPKSMFGIQHGFDILISPRLISNSKRTRANSPNSTKAPAAKPSSAPTTSANSSTKKVVNSCAMAGYSLISHPTVGSKRNTATPSASTSPSNTRRCAC